MDFLPQASARLKGYWMMLTFAKASSRMDNFLEAIASLSMVLVGSGVHSQLTFPAFQNFIQLTSAHEVDLIAVMAPPIANPGTHHLQHKVQSVRAPGLEEPDNSSHHSRTSAWAQYEGGIGPQYQR